MIDEKLLKILACPACESRPAVNLSQDKNHLVCSLCGRSYPIKNGIPVMLVEESVSHGR